MARLGAPAPGGRRRRGLDGPRARLFAPGRRGPGDHRRPDRPPQPRLFRGVLRPAVEAPADRGPGRDPDDRHRPLQEAQRPPRPRDRRPCPAARGALHRGTVRDDDVPARFGGEEFVVLLRNPTRAAAMDVAERVRRAVADLDLSSLKVDRISVSVGVGVAETADEDGPGARRACRPGSVSRQARAGATGSKAW